MFLPLPLCHPLNIPCHPRMCLFLCSQQPHLMPVCPLVWCLGTFKLELAGMIISCSCCCDVNVNAYCICVMILVVIAGSLEGFKWTRGLSKFLSTSLFSLLVRVCSTISQTQTRWTHLTFLCLVFLPLFRHLCGVIPLESSETSCHILCL